ncbi:MAG TPA: transporter substrate-binding domain-containing protein [Solirubrobacteraceae bacterium]|jgi:polar amino acid transport system substrate-binding protein|nr:transporter substrate-binding domain-containing protein [Solirubrobacteraceae bacterium]
MRRALRPVAVAVAAILAAATLAGCASVSDDAQDSSLAALETTEPKPRTRRPPADDCGETRYQSRRPSVLPRAGHMPAGTYMHTIQEEGHLVAGVDQNSLGLGYFNPVTRELEGFDIDVVGEVARAIFGGEDFADHIVYKAISTPQRESAIYFGDVDIVASAFSITCKRQQQMSFSSVYHRTRQRLLVPDDSDDDSFEDLRDKKVCVTKKSTSIVRLEESGAIPVPVDLRSDCLAKLQEREVAAITSDETILFGFCQQDPQTKIVGPSLAAERYGLAINKLHQDFVSFVNAALLRGHDRLERSRKRWLQGLEGSGDDDITDCKRPDTS